MWMTRNGRPRSWTKNRRWSAAQIIREATVPEKREAVWRLWTTSEGLESFLVPKAIVELRVGGTYELHFDPESPWGSRGSEGCRVLSYLEPRLLSFTWNAPPSMPKERFFRTRVVVEFEEAGLPGHTTRVRITHVGFGEGGQWPEVVGYFERAWSKVLDALKMHIDQGPHAYMSG